MGNRQAIHLNAPQFHTRIEHYISVVSKCVSLSCNLDVATNNIRYSGSPTSTKLLHPPLVCHYAHVEDVNDPCRPTNWSIFSEGRFVYIVFKDQEVDIDWFANVSFLSDILNEDNEGIRGNCGYWAEIRLEIKEIVRELVKVLRHLEHVESVVDNIIITGHSKGGGLAQMLVYRLLTDDTNIEMKDLKVSDKIVGITFGAPMVFSFTNTALVIFLKDKLFNYIIATDPVPYMPRVLHKNKRCVDMIIDGAIESSSIQAHIGVSYKFQLGTKASKTGQYAQFYRPVGTLFVSKSANQINAELSSNNIDLKLQFVETDHELFLTFADSNDMLLSLSSHDISRYNSQVAQMNADFHSCVSDAIANDRDAQWSLGTYYLLGTGVTKNAKLAFDWFLKSANGGHQQAQLKVALFYSNAICPGVVFVNSDMAEMYFRQAGMHATPLRQLPDIIHWWTYKSNIGDGEMQAHLGRCYEHGRYALPMDTHEALRLYRLSAEQGNGTGQAFLGSCHEHGRCGLPKNFTEAERLYHLSTEQGNGDVEH